MVSWLECFWPIRPRGGLVLHIRFGPRGGRCFVEFNPHLATVRPSQIQKIGQTKQQQSPREILRACVLVATGESVLCRVYPCEISIASRGWGSATERACAGRLLSIARSRVRGLNLIGTFWRYPNQAQWIIHRFKVITTKI